jgi:hypothetical protein
VEPIGTQRQLLGIDRLDQGIRFGDRELRCSHFADMRIPCVQNFGMNQTQDDGQVGSKITPETPDQFPQVRLVGARRPCALGVGLALNPEQSGDAVFAFAEQ